METSLVSLIGMKTCAFLIGGSFIASTIGYWMGRSARKDRSVFVLSDQDTLIIESDRELDVRVKERIRAFVSDSLQSRGVVIIEHPLRCVGIVKRGWVQHTITQTGDASL